MPTFDWSKLQALVTAVKTACDAGALGAGTAVAKIAQRNVRKMGRFAASAPGMPPASKRGQLRNSIQAQKATQPMTAVIGAAVFYGGVLETGNWGRPITAKTTKFLPVPINDAAKRLNEQRGMMSLDKFDMRLIKPMFGRQMLLVGNNGVRTQLYKTDASGKRKTIVRKDQPVFVLKRSITIKPRPFLVPALRAAKGDEQVWDGFARAVNNGLRRAGFKSRVVRA